MSANNDILANFQEALAAFVEKIKQDNYVIAALLAGSLAYDTVWRKSDIDIILIVEDGKEPQKFLSLLENNIIINTFLFSRHKFKRDFESALNSSQFHSWISKTTLLFTRDDSIKDYYENLFDIGENDKQLLLLKYGTFAAADLAKAQKFLYVKNDYMYSYFWITKSIDHLASIETILHNDIPSRDVIQQGLKYNPEFFTAIYTDLAQQTKDYSVIDNALNLFEKYLEDRTLVLFQLVLNLLAETGNIVAISELHKRIAMTLPIDPALLLEGCEWLVEKGVIQKFPTSARLTTKSRVFVDEAGYYFSGGVCE